MIISLFTLAMLIFAIAETTNIKINDNVNINSNIVNEQGKTITIEKEIVTKGARAVEHEYYIKLTERLENEVTRIRQTGNIDLMITAINTLKNVTLKK